MRILGISAFYHDSAASLVENGKIIAAAQEERFTRKKHDHNFPLQAALYCLKEGGITVDDLDYVIFYDKPVVKFERILETYFRYAPAGLRSFLKAMPLWLKKKLHIPALIAEELSYKGEILFCNHHQSHAASAFFPSPFREAAIMTLDAVGEWDTTSWGFGKDNHIILSEEMRFPHSLGLLYSAFTYYTGFKVNSGEYKLMGLAPYGEPKYVQTILDNLLDIKEDGSFRLNMQYFDYPVGLKMTNERFNRLFGLKPRAPETKMIQEYMDIASSIQKVTEQIILKMARHVKNQTKAANLCLAGGVALNCVANGLLLREKLFDNIWIQPAAGDAGGALGAALFAHYQILNNQRQADNKRDQMQGAYLGPAFSDAEIQAFLDARKVPYRTIPKGEAASVTADLIAKQSVVGLFQGRMEFGPRALGNRSILGDATSTEMQRHINLSIKFRESFRPFAPSVMEEKISDWFDIACSSPYMLLVAPVKAERCRQLSGEELQLKGIDKLKARRSSVPAITHVDYSARIQSVSADTNPFYHEVIKKFEEKKQCPLIINTSFNVRGEPIVCTPEDAYRCFIHTNMDYLVLGSFLLDKKEQPVTHIEPDWEKQFEPD